MPTERVTRYVRLVVDASGAKSGGREVQRTLNDINRSTQRTAAAMNGLRRALIGTFAGVGLAQGIRAIVGGASRAEAQFSQLAAQIETTGGTANRSLADIEKLAQDIGINTLASTQDIRDAAGTLLTFKNVAGEVFDDTLRLTQDLAEAGFGNLRTNAIQLGKALNDPVRGLNGLSRAGIQFTEQQKDQIKSLVQSGDLFEAQTLILKELESQVGGASVAAAQGFSGALDTLIERGKLFAEAFGGQALSPLSSAIRILANGIGVVTENLSALNGAIIGVATVAIPRMAAGFATLLAVNPFAAAAAGAAALGAVIGKVSSLTLTFGDSSATVGQIVGTIWRDVSNVVGTFFSDAFGWIGEFISSFTGIATEGRNVWQFLITASKNWLNFNIASFKSLVDAGIGAFKALAAAGFDTFRSLGNSAASFGKAATLALKLDFTGARAEIGSIGDGIDFSNTSSILSQTANQIGDNFATDFIGAASSQIGEYLSDVTSRAASRNQDNTATPGRTFDLSQFNEQDGGTGGGRLRSPTADLENDTSAETWAKRTSDALNSVGDSFGQVADLAASSLGKQSAAFKAAFAVTKASALATAIVNTAQAVTEALKLPPPAGQIQASIAAAAGAAQVATITSSAINGFQSGGFTGTGPRNGVAGLVHNEEFVMNAEATRRNRDQLEAMNSGKSAGAEGNITVIVVDDREKVGDYLQSANGERIVMAHVGANS